jgi:hypothetical protein
MGRRVGIDISKQPSVFAGLGERRPDKRVAAKAGGEDQRPAHLPPDTIGPQSKSTEVDLAVLAAGGSSTRTRVTRLRVP